MMGMTPLVQFLHGEPEEGLFKSVAKGCLGSFCFGFFSLFCYFQEKSESLEGNPSSLTIVS